MGIYTNSKGEVIEIPDDVPAERRNQILREEGIGRAEARRNQRSGSAPVSDRKSRVQRRADAMEKSGNSFGFGGSVARGLSMGFTDKIAGAIGAGMGAIRKGTLSDIGEDYEVGKDTEAELARRYRERHSVRSGVGETLGAVMAPIGTGAGALKVGSKLLAPAAPKAAARVARAATRLNSAGNVTKGTLAGMNAGALTAAGNSDIEDWGDTVGAGAIGGALTGGLMSGAAHLGGKVVDTMRRARPANAENVALERVAELLRGGGKTPAGAERELATAAARGNSSQLMDLTPSLNAEAAAVSRRSGVPSSNQMIEGARGRMADRRTRFAEQAMADASVPANRMGDDALEHAAGLQAKRKEAGARGYEKGGLMDEPLAHTDELDKFLRDMPPASQAALRKGYAEMLDWDEIPASLATSGTFTHIPNLRTFDYAKRAMDSEISAALKVGDSAGRTKAEKLSRQLEDMKAIIGQANPKYGELLAGQRDLFRQQRATEMGSQFWKRISAQPRQMLADVRKLNAQELQDWRIGALDNLVQMEAKNNPVSMFYSAQRTPAQKQVMEVVMGGPKELARFNRWIKREMRGQNVDEMVGGKQSITSTVRGAVDDADGGAASTLFSALKGWAFGGAAGGASNLATSARNIYSGTPMSKNAQEEIAKLLMSRGEGLGARLDSAAKRSAESAARRTDTIQRAGRAAGYNTADSMFRGSN